MAEALFESPPPPPPPEPPEPPAERREHRERREDPAVLAERLRRIDLVGAAQAAGWQAYLQSNGTLRNKLGIADAAELERAARRRTAARAVQIETGAAGAFAHTPAGYKTLHRHLFQEVFDWAGRNRTVNMTRNEQMPDGAVRTSQYIHARFIDQGLQVAFDQLAPALPTLRAEAGRPPASRDAGMVASVAAAHVGALNYVHAFRDGNGRAMRERVTHLAREAGLRFDQSKLDRAAWNAGCHRVNEDPKDVKPLAAAIAAALEPRERQAERSAALPAAAAAAKPRAKGRAAAKPGETNEEQSAARTAKKPPAKRRPRRSRGDLDITE